MGAAHVALVHSGLRRDVYRGFVFHTRRRGVLYFASSVEVVEAKRIWVPA
jgi:hypothetical protein